MNNNNQGWRSPFANVCAHEDNDDDDDETPPCCSTRSSEGIQAVLSRYTSSTSASMQAVSIWGQRQRAWDKSVAMWKRQRAKKLESKSSAAEAHRRAQRQNEQDELTRAEEWSRRIVEEGDAIAEKERLREMREEEEERAKGVAARQTRVRSVTAVHQLNSDPPSTNVPLSSSSLSHQPSSSSFPLLEIWCGSLELQKFHLDSVKHLNQGKVMPALLAYDKIMDGLLDTNSDRALSATTLSTARHNRGFILYKLDRYAEALAEALKATELDTDNISGYLLAARSYVMLLQVRHARLMYTYLTSVTSGDAEKKERFAMESAAADDLEKYLKHVSDGNFVEAKRAVSRIVAAVGGVSMTTEGLRVECIIHLQPELAAVEVSSLQNRYGDHSTVLFLRAKCLFYGGLDPITVTTAQQLCARAIAASGNCDRARALESVLKKFEHLQHDHQGNVSHRRWQAAASNCTGMLACDPYNTKLHLYAYTHRGTAQMRCENYSSAVSDFTKAIEKDVDGSHTVDLLVLRAEAYTKHDKLVDAIADYEEAYRQVPIVTIYDRLEKVRKDLEAQRQKKEQQQQQSSSSSNNNYYNNTNHHYSRYRSAAAAKQQKEMSRTYYDILGVERGADVSIINKAYRDAALKWHPDRWVSATDEQKRSAESVFKQVNHAYTVLSDDTQRRSYDASIFFTASAASTSSYTM
eukprot:PhM_4_TR10969/c1_g1_i1/m.91143/K09527/DNAJC7; DnaJ homolog subfamily C member 7